MRANPASPSGTSASVTRLAHSSGTVPHQPMRPPDDFKFNIKAFRLLTGHQTPPNVFPPDIQQALPPLSGRKKNWYYADLPREIVDEIWLRFKAAVEPLKAACKLRAVHFQYLHSAMVFGAGIAITFAAYRLLNLIAVAAFWIAYILTREGLQNPVRDGR
ncbi:DUF72 domain-containing protein [Pelomonas puraquae]|nr:DUF72 domain-containing protein [Roseateles puraquae]